MLAACIAKANQYESSVVSLWTSPCNHSNWLEWQMDVHFDSGKKLFIGCIQRSPSAEIEFCS